MAEGTEALLSERLETLRVWWAAYVHDGVELTPEAVARLTTVFADLTRQAFAYEDLMSEAHRLMVAVRTDALMRGDLRMAKRQALQSALDAAGLAGAVRPAAMLTEAQRADPKISVLAPRRTRHPHPGEEAAP